jgi:hypothetical protein
MKTLRQHMLVLGALLSATGLAAETVKVASHKPALPLPTAPSYQKVSVLEMLDTMKGRKNFITWTCYAKYNGTIPAERRTVWLSGVLKDRPDATNGDALWDIGAQHRDHQIKLRILTANGDVAPAGVLLQKTDGSGATPATQPTPDKNDFYTIEPNGSDPAINQYLLMSDDNKLTLEAYYADHPPAGGFLKIFSPKSAKQIEDGGPPSIPPVNEN